jgi:hypothetical protein
MDTDSIQSLFDSILEHPYLQRFAAAELNREHIANVWLIQQGWLSRTFPKTFPAILERIPELPDYTAIHRALAQIISVENASDAPDSHPRQFVHMARVINPSLDFSASTLPEPLPETYNFVTRRQSSLEDHNIFYGLGTLFANEYLNAHDTKEPTQKRGVMVAYSQGLSRLFPEHAAALKYVATHVAGEDNDAELLYNTAMKLAADVAANPGYLSRFASTFKDIADPAQEPQAAFDTGVFDYLQSRKHFFNALERSLD